MKRKALMVVLGVVVVLIGASFLIGSDRTPAKSVAQKTVGSVVLDSSAHVATLNAVEELRIDGTKEEFVPIYRVYVAHDGTIIVPQLQNLQYVRYSADGKKLGSFGTEGSGPCEFRSKADQRAGWIGDTLWIHDPNARRITYVNPAGECVGDETVRYAFAAPRDLGRFPLLTQIIPWGVYDGRYIALASNSQSLLKPEAWKYEHALISVGASGMIDRIIGDFPLMSPGAMARTGTEKQGMSVSLPLRLHPVYSVSSRSDRIGYATVRTDMPDGGHIRLVVLDPHGDTTLVREYAFVGTRITEGAVDSIIAAWSKQLRPELAELVRTETRKGMPPFYQPLRAMLFGQDSTIWLQVREPNQQTMWLMLDNEGTPVGTLKLAARASLAVAQRDAIWTIELDKDDVPSVVRYRLEKAASR